MIKSKKSISEDKMFKKVLSEQRELGTKEEIRKHLQEQIEIEKIVPENLWAKKVLAEAEANGVDFYEMWDNIKKKLREEANERAKKDTSIN